MKVYVSSTFLDLKQHRERVNEGLRRSRYTVVAMEDYAAASRRPLKKCLDDVAKCDVYIGIFGWRYGYVPADHNPKGYSITEHEYRKAVELGKDVLIFLLDPDAPWSPGFMDSHTGEGDSGIRIETLRKELSEKWVVSVFTDPDHLASLVQSALHETFMKMAEKDAIAATDSKPAQSTPWILDGPKPVVGSPRPFPHSWLIKAIQCGQSVAKLTDKHGEGWGTGFLLQGRLLNERLSGQTVLITSGVVVSEGHSSVSAMRPSEAEARFDTLTDWNHNQVVLTQLEQVWTSPPERLDTTVLTFAEDAPEAAHAIELASALPRAGEGSEPYVVGHPSGFNLKYSIAGTRLLGYDVSKTRAYYIASTDPGSAGSPVFNSAWQLLAMNHASSEGWGKQFQLPSGMKVSEGITIEAVREEMARTL